MNQIKNILIIILPVFFGIIELQAQDTLKISLQDCRTMAIENSEVVKIADQNIAKAKGERMAAKSAWYPNISASAMGMYSKQEIQEELYLPTAVFNPLTGGLEPNIAINPGTGQPIIGPDGNPIFNTYAYLPIDLTIYGGAMAGVSAEQPIYAGGKIIAGNKMAQIGENMASANKELKQAELIFTADQYYYQYLSVKEKVKLAKEYQLLLAELVNIVGNSFEAGMTNRNELLKVQVKYNEASLQVQKAETGFALTQMSLCRIIGLDLYTSLSINDSISSTSFILDSISGLNASNRIEYQLMQSQVKMAEQNIKMIRGDYMPTAGVSLGYNFYMASLKNMDNYDQNG